jgi:transposase-like protein
MKPIPPERREAILARLSGPARESVARVAALEGISPATLYLWRRKASLNRS